MATMGVGCWRLELLEELLRLEECRFQGKEHRADRVRMGERREGERSESSSLFVLCRAVSFQFDLFASHLIFLLCRAGPVLSCEIENRRSNLFPFPFFSFLFFSSPFLPIIIVVSHSRSTRQIDRQTYIQIGRSTANCKLQNEPQDRHEQLLHLLLLLLRLPAGDLDLRVSWSCEWRYVY